MKITAFLIIAILSLPAYAQDHLDGGATQLLDDMSARYQAYSTMQINYTYKAEKDKKVLDTFKGEMLIKGKMYYLTIPGQVFYCDGTTIWNYQKEVDEISVFEYEEEDDNLMNPAQLLAGWKKNYRAKMIREEFESGKALVLIDITPVKLQPYYRIRLFVDKNKKEILRFTVYEKDNTLYTYYFDQFIPNRPIEDRKFKLNKSDYPNAVVNDMR